MASDTNPAGFEIDGEVYEVPRFDQLNMDEAQILYDLSGVVVEDFIPAHPDAPEDERKALEQLQVLRLRDPAFKRALVVIAYVRKHPDADVDETSKIVGKINYTDVSVAVLTRGDDVDPSTSSPKQPESRNGENGTSPPSSSGKPSGSDLDPRDVRLSPTGTGPLVTFSPESVARASGS